MGIIHRSHIYLHSVQIDDVVVDIKDTTHTYFGRSAGAWHTAQLCDVCTLFDWLMMARPPRRLRGSLRNFEWLLCVDLTLKQQIDRVKHVHIGHSDPPMIAVTFCTCSLCTETLKPDPSKYSLHYIYYSS